MFNATKPALLALVIAIFMLPATVLADMASFKKAYQEYNTAVESKDWPAALKAADKSLAEGLAIFNPDGQNIANLRFNYARELERAGDAARAADQLKQCLAANKKMHGENSDEVLTDLMELGKVVAPTDGAAAEGYFTRAMAIVDAGDNEALQSSLKLTAGITMVQNNRSDAATPWLEAAHKYYLKTFGEKDGRAGLSALSLGRIYASSGDNEDARKVLEGALPAFAANDPVSRKFNSQTRRVLVNVLESMGLRDAATPHCVAIALADADGAAADPELLRRVKGAQISGSFDVSFSVDERGIPADVQVTKSTNKPLNSKVIEWVSNWRYAPAIEKGKPVKKTGMSDHLDDSEVSPGGD